MLSDRFANLKPAIKIAILTAPFLIVMTIGLIIYFITKPADADLHFQNINEVGATIPRQKLQATENQIASLLSSSTDTPISDLSSDLYIRPDSYSEETSGDITTASFLVDIDKYQQTFRVIVSWVTNGDDYLDDIVVNCPTIFETKYPDSKCVGMNGSSDDIELNLPYTDILDTGEKYVVSMNYDDPSNPYIEVFLEDACYNDDLIQRAQNATKDWIKNTLNLNPDNYTYETPDYFCRANRITRN